LIFISNSWDANDEFVWEDDEEARAEAAAVYEDEDESSKLTV
jgi:hypothetical protein